MASHTPTIETQNNNNDNSGSLTGIPLTSLSTAAVRALESSLPEDKRQFNDPYASKLAGPAMEKIKEDKDRAANMMWINRYIVDRTVYFDNAIQEYLIQHPKCKQIVILGSGMDTRAYRMGLPADLTLFEIDYAQAHDYKTVILKDDQPSCQRIVVKADMAKDDWTALLTSAHNDNLGTGSGAMFDSTQVTLWLAEGLTMYIPEAVIGQFCSYVNALSAKESAFIFDGWSSREQFSAILSESSFNFLASLADDTLDPLNKLGWHVHHAHHHPGTDGRFYTMLKQ